jgi:hypothetical protein
MKVFYNDAFQAPNVLTIPVDFSKIRHLKERFQSEEHSHKYAVSSPDWSSDIKWISPNTIEEFKLFDNVFRDLGVAEFVREYVDF